MKGIITYCIVLISMACTTGQQPEITIDTFSEPTDKSHTTDEPYELFLEIEKSLDNEFRIVANIVLQNGAYTASPLSNNNFTGLFTISLDNNTLLSMDDNYEETPQSVEVMDTFENVPVNWVRENTTYKRKLNINTEEDFEVSGLVSFTIEPRCTFEKIPFVISYNSGNLEITKSDIKK